MNEYMEKYLSIHSFSFPGPSILEENIEDSQSKLTGLKRFKLLSTFKDDNAVVHKAGLKIKE